MWQFVKFRGNQYGLAQTASSDDRFDPEKATRAAARHLKDLYTEFGDWYLAIAAYNCGPGCVEKAVERTGYADYWELRARHAIPAETTNYVPIILAMTIMAKNAPEYGLDQVVPEQPWQFDTVRLTAPTNLALISDLTDASIPYEVGHAHFKSIARAQIVERQVRAAGLTPCGAVRLLAMPRILGYAFNPLSVYFCDDADGTLQALIYEVRNTFGGRHS